LLGARTLLLLLAVLAMVASVAALGIGAMSLSPGTVLSILASSYSGELPAGVTSQEAAVVNSIRAPRVVLGLLVGAGLSTSGALMQGLFRNPLADPGLIGVSSGAALAAALVIVLGGTLTEYLVSASPQSPVASVLAVIFGSTLALPLAAFAGGAFVTLVVMRLSRFGQQTSVETMLLAGIAINAIAGAGTGILVALSDDAQLRSLTFWTLGSLGGARWDILPWIAPLLVAPVFASPFLAESLDALLLGEEEAHHLGVDVERLKRWVVTLAALAVGAAVAFTGIIGFVGLVVPHLIRLTAGPRHRVVLPGSALLGGGLLVAADMVSRTIIAPAELPIGVVTTLLGGPFFLALLARRWGQ
jgi:iron complex transport system permease protein